MLLNRSNEIVSVTFTVIQITGAIAIDDICIVGQETDFDAAIFKQCVIALTFAISIGNQFGNNPLFQQKLLGPPGSQA
jgi:hypothetical protein